MCIRDRIIRRPRNSVVVVNGVAGSGKTTIALHRIAYLLYNNREVLKDKMLILLSLIHISSEAFIEELDNLVKNMDENAEVREIKYFDNVVQSIDDIKDMLYNHFKTMPLYRRKKKIKRIVFSKLRDARNERVWDICLLYTSRNFIFSIR